MLLYYPSRVQLSTGLQLMWVIFFLFDINLYNIFCLIFYTIFVTFVIIFCQLLKSLIIYHVLFVKKCNSYFLSNFFTQTNFVFQTEHYHMLWRTGCKSVWYAMWSFHGQSQSSAQDQMNVEGEISECTPSRPPALCCLHFSLCIAGPTRVESTMELSIPQHT